jgi:hypothetical protein
VRRHCVLTTVLVGVILVALSFARERKSSVDARPYSLGEMLCQLSDDRPGVRLRLRQTRHCEGGVSYPYVELDIGELAIPVRKRITIGVNIWAMRCLKPNQACEQSSSGTVEFDHFEKGTGKAVQTDGYYVLRFRDGQESGHFRVDCRPPCIVPSMEIALP